MQCRLLYIKCKESTLRNSDRITLKLDINQELFPSFCCIFFVPCCQAEPADALQTKKDVAAIGARNDCVSPHRQI